MARAEAPPSRSEPDAEEVELSVDGEAWVARVSGRSGRSGAGAAPLLLVGFWPADASTGGAQREAFVVGRTLSGVATDVLERACERARRVPSADA